MLKIKELLRTGFIVAAFTLPISALATPHFSKVYFFGDSLSDIGNNQDSAPAPFNTDKAPVVEKVPNGTGGFTGGELWVQPFLQHLADEGILAGDATHVFQSHQFDIGLLPTENESVDYAYSGDNTGGIGVIKDIDVTITKQPLYHAVGAFNGGCIGSFVPGIGGLCGMRNRITNYATHYNLDPNALYVIFAGANDFQQGLMNEEKPEHIIISTINNIEYSIAKLQEHGARHFMVVNLPNLGFTPGGSQQGPIVTGLLGQLTAAYNGELKKDLDNIQANNDILGNDITIVQADLNSVFALVRTGKIPSFPKETANINVTEVHSWLEKCCTADSNHPATSPSYDPNSCFHYDATNHPQCNGPAPSYRINGTGKTVHYLFFNEIHPTQCAHKYLAKFFALCLKSGEKHCDASQFETELTSTDLCSAEE